MSIQKLKKWSPTQQQLLTRRSIVVNGLTVEIEQGVVSNQDGEAKTNRGRPASSEVGKVLWPGEFLDNKHKTKRLYFPFSVNKINNLNVCF